MNILIMSLSIVDVSIVGVLIMGTPTMDRLIKGTPNLEGDSYAELWSDLRQRIEYS